jgi:hypothetical protein
MGSISHTILGKEKSKKPKARILTYHWALTIVVQWFDPRRFRFRGSNGIAVQALGTTTLYAAAAALNGVAFLDKNTGQ